MAQGAGPVLTVTPVPGLGSWLLGAAVLAPPLPRQPLPCAPAAPPSILGEELNVSVAANVSVALECQSHALPPPVLSWWKDGRPLEPRPGVRLSADKALLEVGGRGRTRGPG